MLQVTPSIGQNSNFDSALLQLRQRLTHAGKRNDELVDHIDRHTSKCGGIGTIGRDAVRCDELVDGRIDGAVTVTLRKEQVVDRIDFGGKGSDLPPAFVE